MHELILFGEKSLRHALREYVVYSNSLTRPNRTRHVLLVTPP